MATSEQQAELRELLLYIGTQFDGFLEGKLQPYNADGPSNPSLAKGKVIPAAPKPQNSRLETTKDSKTESFSADVKTSAAENKIREKGSQPGLAEAETEDIEDDWVMLMNTA